MSEGPCGEVLREQVGGTELEEPRLTVEHNKVLIIGVKLSWTLEQSISWLNPSKWPQLMLHEQKKHQPNIPHVWLTL